MTHPSNNQENLHVAGQVEICELKKFHNTPVERNALRRALQPLKQVVGVNFVRNQDGKYFLFAELDLGSPNPAVLRTLTTHVIHRVGQKAKIALEQVQLQSVKSTG